MRTLKRNKQRMYYALFKESEDVYELDKDGNKIIDYTDSEGNVYYRETGTKKNVYYTPVEFYSAISSSLNELHAKEYGVDQSSVFSEIAVAKNYVPLEFGALIWRESEIEWEDTDKTIPKASSSDYTVTGILNEFQNFDFYLLQRNNKEN